MTAVLAHGLVERADIPVPPVVFAWATAAVLVLSLVALAALWPQPRLEQPAWRALPGGGLLGSRAVAVVCGAVGVALLALTVWAGFAGEQGREANFAPTFVYIIFWVGLVVASLLLGDVFRALNPWRVVGRALHWNGRRPYPERLGHWPAALGLLAFHLDRARRALHRPPGPDRRLRGRLLGADVGGDVHLRDRDVGRARRGVRRLLQPLLPGVGV